MAYIDDPLRAPKVEAARHYFRRWLKKRLEVHVGPLDGWRTDAKLAVRAGTKGPRIGLFLPGSHEVYDMDDCRAHHSAINKALRVIRKACVRARLRGFDERAHCGDLRYLKLEAQRSTGRVQLTLVWHAASVVEAGEPLQQLLAHLGKKSSLWYSIWVNFNPAGRHVSRILAFPRESWELLTENRRFLRERLSDCPVPYKAPRLCFPPYVFRQANLCQFGKIVASLRRFVPADSCVVELYGGVGTIGLHLADLVRSLVCSDENPHNERCFEKSQRDLPEEIRDRLCYRQGNAASQVASLQHCDVLIVDPPRKGLDEEVVRALLPPAVRPRLRLVLYVSCGFPALQRDIGRLEEGGWSVTHAEGFVLFPGADHIESFCVLERQG